VLDGWWPEASDDAGGWSLSGEVDPDHAAQDARHAAELLRVPSVGTVEAGKAADLVLWPGDPLDDPLLLLSPVAVLKGGEVVAGAL